MLAGAGASYLYWRAKSSIPDNDFVSLEVDYDLDSTFYQSLYFQGRYGNTQLAINYLENKFKEQGNTEKQISRAFNLFLDFSGIDFNDFIDKQTTIRLKSETSEIYGVAHIKEQENSDTSFVTKYQSLSAMLMFERGLYYGLEYANYEMPSALGFSNRDLVVTHAKYDPSLGIHRLALLFGYDEMSYAARYETNYFTHYISGEISGGLAYLDITGNVKDEVESSSGKTINTPTPFTFGAKLDAGFAAQRRLKALRGAGISFFVGYRVNYISFSAEQGENLEESEKIEEDELSLEFERYDVWHGPFANINLVF